MITLRVFLYGLLAFVTDDPIYPNNENLTILMVDARRPPVSTDGCAMHKHLPRLFHREIKDCKEPCRVERGLCSCPLERVEVTVKKDDLETVAPCRSGQTPPCNVSVLYWHVPRNLGSSVAGGPSLKRSCLYSKPTSAVCDFVVAQVSIEPDAIFACDMMNDRETTMSRLRRYRDEDNKAGESPVTERFYLEATHVPINSLVRTGVTGKEQAIASVLLLTREIKDDEVKDDEVKDDKGAVRFRLQAFDETERFDVSLKKSAAVDCRTTEGKRSQCLDVVIANVPDASHDELQYARCRDHRIARDFELYEDLAQGGSGLDNRPVPQEADTDTYSEVSWSLLCGSDILADLVYWLRDVDDMPACPNQVIKRPI